LKKYLFYIFILANISVKAQAVDSIYVNLYTDSLKRGTYNYINIDGLMSNGKYLPLDSTHIFFSASAGRFYGNSLFIDKNITADKVNIRAVLRNNPAIYKEFTMYIKIKTDNQNLKTVDELLNGTTPKRRRAR
jgi:hypothetical protein